MTTISVPLPANLEELIKRLAKKRGSNKAAIVREALLLLEEEEAVVAVLKAEKEQHLRGDLRLLARKLRS